MRVLFFIALIIILVSLMWFREGRANDLSSLTPDQIHMLKQYQQKSSPKTANPSTYQSPDLYDTTAQVVRRPELREGFRALPNDTIRDEEQKKELTPFSKLRPYGSELFQSPEELLPPSEVAASPDYVLGPGDNLIVNLWGRVDKEFNLTVDREGKILLPKVGELTVSGQSLAQAKDRLRQRLLSVYSDFEINVSLGKIRAIRVFLTGEVRRPGAYTVSSLTSLFNALYLAGGPTDNGSLRSIRLVRAGGTVREFDLYAFLLKGENQSDIRLESGDAIVVPVASGRVAIRGEIRREAIYELRGGESLSEILTLAGGANATAYLNKVTLERISRNQEWQLVSLNALDSSTLDGAMFPMKDGDRVTIRSVFDEQTHIAAVFGMVKHEGYYQQDESTTVASLLSAAQLRDYDVNFARANLFRRHANWETEIIPIHLRAALDGNPSHNLPISNRDSLHVYALREVQREMGVYIEGEVRKPGRYPLYGGMTITDLIFLSGSYTRAASRLQAEIARVDSTGEVSLTEISLLDSIGLGTTLRDDDRVYVRQIPQWRLHLTVQLEGEVSFPGEYVLSSRSETLYDLLNRAGGFTSNAFPQGLVFERQSVGQNLSRLRLPELLNKSNPIVRDTTGTLTRTRLFEYDSLAVNRIVIDVNRMLASKGENGNIVLEPGDKIIVPSIPSGISVLGAVSSNGTIGYAEKRSVAHYIKQAGNFSRSADKRGTSLIKANGIVYSGGGTLGQRVERGDIIVVPTRVKTERDNSKTLTTFLTTTSGILTTLLLARSL